MKTGKDTQDTIFSENCITQVAATILELLGVGPLSIYQSAVSGGILSDEGAGNTTPAMLSDNAAPILESVLEAASIAFDGASCDRVFMYNPDAIAWWIYQKYKPLFAPLEAGHLSQSGLTVSAYKASGSPIMLQMRSVVPPKTPVCFASMYSGLLPEEHGIRKYEKPVLTVPTIFDALPAAGKKVAIVSTAGDSISLIFLNRPVDYFIYKTKQECNAKALDLIREDKYDVIVLYNGDYDYWMHRVTPTGFMARHALKQDIETWSSIRNAIYVHWQEHRTALAFAPDHGCHAKLGFPPGDHGDEVASDMNIPHWWSFL